jgi:hypothetical protein
MRVADTSPGLQQPTATRRDPRAAANSAASPAEAAAIVAAIERFMRATAPPSAPPAAGRDAWTRAAILEAVGHEDDAPSAWGDPLPWG